jgi:hypothetical protein
MTVTVLGIDISKNDFYIVLPIEDQKTKPKKFTNDPAGFDCLQQWLQKQSVEKLHSPLTSLFDRHPLTFKTVSTDSYLNYSVCSEPLPAYSPLLALPQFPSKTKHV